MAGIEAANLIRKQTGLQHWLEATADILEAHSIAKRLGHKGEIDRLHANALATLEASTILKENRPALDALACALIKQTNLSGEEARQIINAAGKSSSLMR